MKFNFDKHGVEKVAFLDATSYHAIKNRLESYILSSLRAPSNFSLENYHVWCDSYDDFRNETLSAHNRHFHNSFWSDIRLIESLAKYISAFLPSYNLTLWDEGLGTSAFRLVRPGFDDGYPPSRKSWGPGGNLISVTIPILGFSKYESQAFLLGSHLQHYQSYIPSSQKFCSEERRLKDPSIYSFTYLTTDPGDIIIYHWNTIHSEQILGKDITRLALEVRFICHE